MIIKIEDNVVGCGVVEVIQKTNEELARSRFEIRLKKMNFSFILQEMRGKVVVRLDFQKCFTTEHLTMEGRQA